MAAAQILAFVRVVDEQAARHLLNQALHRMDILLGGNRRGGGFKRLVRHQIQFMRCENERIPRNPRHRLIRAGQTSVNDEQAAAGADPGFRPAPA